MSKWYAVKKGRLTGVFQTWGETAAQVKGFSGGEYKSFRTEQDAHDYLQEKPEKTSGVEIYTDGSCVDGSGGLGVVVVVDNRVQLQVCRKVKGPTTNNICELQGLYVGLKEAQKINLPVTLYTDSEYSLKAVTVWFKQWSLNNFCTARGRPVANLSLIRKVRRLYESVGTVTIKHVYGHAGCRWNELADSCANDGRKLGENT